MLMKRIALPCLSAVAIVALSACGRSPKTRPVTTEPAAEASLSGGTASSENAGSPQPPQPGPGGDRGRGPNVGPGQMLEHMKTTLGLSDDQAQKVATVFESQRPAMQTLRDDTSLSRDQRREKMREIHKDIQSQLAGILTPDQMAKWEQERAEREKSWRQGGGGQFHRREDASPSPVPQS